ncbi:hypothetical protein B6D52_01755, partial [Candidatus Parcubacteria bacterium 4484_255]
MIKLNSKKYIFQFTIALFIISAGFLLLPKMAMAGITYDAGTDTITVVGDATCGNTESNACNFNDIYNVDKAGTFTLVDRDGITDTDADPADNTYNLRPADEKLLGGAKHDLYIVVENWNATSATVKLIGTNKNGDSLTEDINITGNGTYYASNLFKTLTQTQVTTFTGTNFDYSLVQGQWGVISKPSSSSYYWKNTKLIIGDGSTATYFVDTRKQITIDSDVVHSWGSNYYIYIHSNAYFRLGEYVDEENKITKNGCQFLFLQTNRWFRAIITHSGADVHILSSEFLNAGTADSSPIQFGNVNHRFWNCMFQRQWFQYRGKGNLYNVAGYDVSNGFFMTGTFDRISVFGGAYMGRAYGGTYTYAEPYIRNTSYIFHGHNFILNIIDADTDTWSILWYSTESGNARLYRQYTFNLKIVDKEGIPISGAKVKIWDKNDNIVVDTTTDSNGRIAEQTITYKEYAKDVIACEGMGNCSYSIITTYSPHKIRISHQDYPSREFEFTLDKKIDWTIALKDKPMSIGSIKAWGTEYADDEAGTIYAQVFYGDGSPCNTLASSSITATVYKSDGTKIIDGAQMTYVTGSNGIYKYDFPANTFSDEGVYIIDVMASSTDPNITAYNSNEIHISKSANLISQNLDQKISEVASSTWSYTGRSLDNIDNIISGVWDAATSTMTTTGSIGKLIVENLDDKISNIAQNVWSYTGSALDTTGNAISKIWSFATRKLTSREITADDHIAQEENIGSNVWSYTGSALDVAGNAIAKVWGYATRKLTSRQIGTDEYIAGVSSPSTVSQVADQPTQGNVEYNVELVRKATFDFAGFADSGSTTTLVDSELTQPDDHWNNYELWMMSGNNIGLKRAICDFDRISHTITLCGGALPQPIEANDQYVISHERKLVHSIWNWTDRQLTSVGNIASAVWGWTESPRKLTSRWT